VEIDMSQIITYEEEVQFKYILPDEDEPRFLEHELTLIWEDSLEAFIKEHGQDKPYKINEFKLESAEKFFLHNLEERTDKIIEEVQEEIANKMKFGFEFSGQLHNDD
jgi:predicted secreted Zn-dependent protease